MQKQKRASKLFMMAISSIIALAVLCTSQGFTAFAKAETISIQKGNESVVQPSNVKFTVKITNTVGGGNTPITGIRNVYLAYPYKSTTEAGNKRTETYSHYCTLTEDASTPGIYSWEGTVRENINTWNADGKKKCYVYFYYEGYFARSQYVEYTDGNTMNFEINFSNKAQTEGWERGSIYCFDDCRDYEISSIDSSGETDDDKRDIGYITLYAGGGKLTTAGGGFKDTKTKQLTLWETFRGIQVNTTKSKQIKWIATKEQEAPTSFNQKSDTSVLKVNKGKVSAVAEGTAYVWACRVDPNDKKKVSVDESCCVEIDVYDVPSKIILKESSSEEASSISSLDLNIGEEKRVYMQFVSKGENPRKDCQIDVTKGSEYISVDYYSDNYFTITALPNVLKDNKPVTAMITVSSNYNSKLAKLKVTIGNGIVKVAQADVAALTVTSSAVKQNINIPAETIQAYIQTSAQEYCEDEEVKKAASTDIPKVFVTSSSDVTKSMVYADKKGKKVIKFNGTKSADVSASYDKKSGDITVKVKKNPTEKSGNIIIVYNTECYLTIPYTITGTSSSSADEN